MHACIYARHSIGYKPVNVNQTCYDGRISSGRGYSPMVSDFEP